MVCAAARVTEPEDPAAGGRRRPFERVADARDVFEGSVAESVRSPAYIAFSWEATPAPRSTTSRTRLYHVRYRDSLSALSTASPATTAPLPPSAPRRVRRGERSARGSPVVMASTPRGVCGSRHPRLAPLAVALDRYLGRLVGQSCGTAPFSVGGMATDAGARSTVTLTGAGVPIAGGVLHDGRQRVYSPLSLLVFQPTRRDCRRPPSFRRDPVGVEADAQDAGASVARRRVHLDDAFHGRPVGRGGDCDGGSDGRFEPRPCSPTRRFRRCPTPGSEPSSFPRP